MERIFFSTKAGTLDALNGVIKNARIPASIFFTSKAWELDPKICLKRIKDHLGKGSFAVRSSGQTEDTEKHSQAGKFLSVLDVSFGDLTREIKLVFASYDNINEDNEVLIQPMLNDVTLSGVAFSHDPNTCSPYRIINYLEGKDTTSITGGKSTGFTWQQASLSPTSSPVKLIPIIKLIDELLKIFDYQPLDIEFCFTLSDPGGLPWLLQARPLILSRVPEPQHEQFSRLRALEQALKQSMRKHPWVTGCKTVFGVMPDWNPAEIIGIRPRPLALSLYKELITDNIWAYQRHNYGYRDLRSFPLLIDFSGLPYIDVRLSFNSFIPSTLNDDLSEKLVDYYVDRLLDSPNLHDKIEFDIVFSCYTFDSNKRLKALAAYDFSDSQIREINNSLKTITKNVFSSKSGIWHKDLEKVNMLEQKRGELFKANLNPIEMVYWLIEDAKRYGSLPFAGLARATFMAV
ncbi:PEP/pyruvate-binding domain-containing protein [Alphaproteobacteria bacterium]|nr:PEP/pyruvate-binding domain-containing protein [Alphaproteobacteria bacterium]